jgi:glycerophosphoryl diester phosphodiesterase
VPPAAPVANILKVAAALCVRPSVLFARFEPPGRRRSPRATDHQAAGDKGAAGKYGPARRAGGVATGHTRDDDVALRSMRRFLDTEDVHAFLDEPGPIAFAHRGGADEAPENTLAAFEIAVALGYRYLETDAYITRDGVLVAFHDARLDRVTDRVGAIAQLSIAEVGAADAGYAFSRDGGTTFPFRGREIGIPRLEEILLRWPDVRVNIDPKADGCVAPLAALLDRLDAWHRVCVGSFSDRRLHQMRRFGRGRACTSMSPREVGLARLAATAGVMPRLGADCIQVPPRRGPVPIVTRRFVAAAHRAGLPVHVWTINEEAAMNRLLDLGVDGIMSDRLRLLRDVFGRRGLQLAPA